MLPKIYARLFSNARKCFRGYNCVRSYPRLETIGTPVQQRYKGYCRRSGGMLRLKVPFRLFLQDWVETKKFLIIYPVRPKGNRQRKDLI